MTRTLRRIIPSGTASALIVVPIFPTNPVEAYFWAEAHERQRRIYAHLEDF